MCYKYLHGHWCSTNFERIGDTEFKREQSRTPGCATETWLAGCIFKMLLTKRKPIDVALSRNNGEGLWGSVGDKHSVC